MPSEDDAQSSESLAVAATAPTADGRILRGRIRMVSTSNRAIVTITLLLTLIAALCFGFIRSRGWLMSVEALQQAFVGWPRPRSVDWTSAYLARQHEYLPMVPLARIIGWLAALPAMVLLARSLSANVPFIIDSPNSRRRTSDWMRIWVDPRLALRGGLALVFSCWVFGVIPNFVQWEPGMSLATRAVFGGVRLLLTELPLSNPLLVHWMASTVTTSLVFVALSSDGFLAPSGFHLRAARRAAWSGAVAGTALAVATLPFTRLGDDHVRFFLRASGPLQAATEQALLGAIVSPPLCAIALALCVLSLSKLPGARSLRAAAVAAIAGVAGLQAGCYRLILVRSLDLGKDLSTIVPLQSEKSSGRRLAILINNRQRCPSAPVEYRTARGLDHSDAGAKRIEAVLRQRQYRTSLTNPAFFHLFDTAALNFDRERALQVCLDNLAGNPLFRTGSAGGLSPQAAELLGEMLPDVAPTATHKSLLKEMCEERRLALDNAYRIFERLGDALMRMGEVDRAEKFYERAGLNPFGIELRRRRLDQGHARVSGRVLIGERPARAAQVGVVSTLKWLTLIGTPLTPPNAFSLRAICRGARTDSEGRFEIDHIGAGEYFLVLLFTPDQVRPQDEVEVENQPGVISIPTDRFRDVGVIRVRPAPASAPAGKEQSI